MAGYDALCAKCRAMHGQMLKQNDYETLSKASTIEEAVQLLTRLPRYQEIFSKREPVFRRSAVEHLLHKQYFSMYEKLLIFSEGTQRTFFSYLMERHEIAYLIRAVHAVGQERSVRFSAVPEYMKARSKLNFAAFYEAETMGELIKGLAGTDYYDAALRFLSGPSAAFDLFENALYRDYYLRLYESGCDVLDPKSKKAVRALLEKQVEQINKQQAARIAEYQMEADASLLIPIHTKQNKAELEAIIRGERADNRLSADVEKRSFFALCQRTVFAGGNTMAVPYALLALGEAELKNLTYVIEGIRYQVGSGFIMEKVII
ncbi:MAG: V-type ATPase subunit [Clostridiales bacterium]|nr:V-type ATPase subunit [Clostridiales bacterium]